MVFFTCNACGESLKKAQVDKHVSICRGCEVLSCIDCGKDFWGNDYKNHVRCISEDQKYGGRGYEAKANKGDVKQQQWLQKIQTAQSKPGVSVSLQRVLEQVATYDNVPRKKSKFENWMKNSLKISNCSLHQQVWDILSADSEPLHKNTASTEAASTVPEIDSSERKNLNKLDQKETQRQKNGLKFPQDCISDVKQDQNEDQGLDQQDPTAQRKRKHKEEQNTKGKKAKKQPDGYNQAPEETEQVAPKGKFNWKGNIKALLREAPDQELPIKKLRKKVLSAFYSFTAEDCNKSEEMVLALFNKKINNNPKFRVLKDRVKLIK